MAYLWLWVILDLTASPTHCVGRRNWTTWVSKDRGQPVSASWNLLITLGGWIKLHKTVFAEVVIKAASCHSCLRLAWTHPSHSGKKCSIMSWHEADLTSTKMMRFSSFYLDQTSHFSIMWESHGATMQKVWFPIYTNDRHTKYPAWTLIVLHHHKGANLEVPRILFKSAWM